jgi:hypothetical protein
MGCFLAGVASLVCGRLFLLIVWIVSDWFARAFDGPWEWLAPILGLIFAPVTVLYCSAVYNWWGGHWDWIKIVGLVICLAIDLGSGGSSRRRRHRREARVEES